MHLLIDGKRVEGGNITRIITVLFLGLAEAEPRKRERHRRESD